MGFSKIQDQEVPVRLLRNILLRQRVPNGLLFWGPAGVGKHTLARELAKALNCSESSEDACDTCLSCRKVMHENHPDVKLIAPSGKTRGIGVATVDFMNELTAYRPFEGRRRVFLIQEADRMRVDAQNHFLKTLEEPPSATLFVLMTEHPRRLLPTIRSRCQQVRFGVLQPETVARLLMAEREIAPEAAEAIATVAQGQMSRALDLVDSEKRNVVLDLTRRLAAGEDAMTLSGEFVQHLRSTAKAIEAAVKAEQEPEDPREMTREEREEAKAEQEAYVQMLVRRDLMEYLFLFAAWYRDELVFRETAAPAALWNQDQVARFEQVQSGAQQQKMSAIEDAWVYVERNLSIDRVFRDLFFALAA